MNGDVSSAYAGYDLGLCKDYGSGVRCLEEDLDRPQEIVLTIFYTSDVLLVNVMEMKSALIFGPSDPTYMVDWKPGLPQYYRNDLSRQAYEELLALRLMKLPLTWLRTEVDRVVLMCECAEAEEISRAVRRAMERLQPGNLPERFQAGTEYVTALGAGELRWRALHS